MKNFWRAFIVLLVIGLIAIGIRGWKIHAQKWIGDIRITGTLKDQDGNPLEPVSVGALETGTEMVDDDVASFSESKVVQSAFSLRFHKVLAVSLTFYPKGYYSQTFDYMYIFSEDDATKNGATQEHRLDLVFKKKPDKLVSLDDFPVRLELNPAGLDGSDSGTTDKVTALAAVAEGETMLEAFRSVYVTTNTLEVSQRPYLVLEAEHDASVVKLYNRPGLDEWGRPPVRLTPLDARVRIVIHNDPDGGFIVYSDPVKGDKFSTYFPPEMEEAPETGYSQFLEIKPEWYLENMGRVYFFFKIDGVYGRGRLRAEFTNGLPEHGLEVTTFLELLGSQKKNDRYLVTGEDRE